MLNAQQVEAMQNSEPTNWSLHDNALIQRSDGDANRFAHDKNLHVRFFSKPRLNPDKSNEAGRAIYEDTVYIEIMMPGEKNNIPVRPAWSQDYQRFPEHYKAFLENREQVVGTPLQLLPFLTEAQVEEFAFFKVRTVEQLANLADSAAQQIMGSQEYKAKAKQFLDAMNGGEALRAEIASLRARLEASEAKGKGDKSDKGSKEELFK